MTMRTYTVNIRDAAGCGGGYWAEVEELPGVSAFSDTLGRLAQEVTAAIEAHVSKLKAAGLAVPDGMERMQENSRRWRIGVTA